MKSSSVLRLLVLGVTGNVSIAMAQSPGTFTPTGSMSTPRVVHTATLLPDGRVLIAGGIATSAASPLASAELYDTSTRTFAATGSMATARFGHTATLLPDGRVLIAGGNAGTGAELYDPSTGTFTATGNMIMAGGSITAGDGSAATLLADGRVLIAHDRTGPLPAAAEVYDPVAGTFSATGDQLVIWFGDQKATLLPDGRVLVVACCTAEQLYDPASGAFSLTGATTSIQADGFAAALLMNGKVLLSGGYAEDGALGHPGTTGAELYDPSIGAFAGTGNMTTGRFGHTATLLGDGAVLIAGSQQPVFLNAAIASAELYDPAAGTFSRTGDMTTGRFLQTATLLPDGTVLIAGGRGPSDDVLASAELYTPQLLAPAPALFSLSGDGTGQGAIWHADTGKIASSANPATAGDVLSMYTTSLFEGGVIPPQAAIGGQLAEILFFGDAPGYPGYYQVNFRMPSGVAPGPAVSVRLTYIGRSSNAVTIGVQ